MNLNQHNLETVRIEKSLKSQNLKENDFNESKNEFISILLKE